MGRASEPIFEHLVGACRRRTPRGLHRFFGGWHRKGLGETRPSAPSDRHGSPAFAVRMLREIGNNIRWNGGVGTNVGGSVGVEEGVAVGALQDSTCVFRTFQAYVFRHVSWLVFRHVARGPTCRHVCGRVHRCVEDAVALWALRDSTRAQAITT